MPDAWVPCPNCGGCFVRKSLGAADCPRCKLRRDEVTDAERYTEYYAFNTEGGRIALASCLRCGAVVLLGDPASGPEIHDAWHEEQDSD